MKTQTHSTSYNKDTLALHVRRRRLWLQNRALSQAQLADLAGIPLRRVRRLENTRALPRDVDALLRLSIALNVQIEALIDPRVMRDLVRDIEWRRRDRAESRLNVGRHPSRHGTPRPPRTKAPSRG